MALTAKQEAFAQGVASGLTQADAYRQAYDCENSSDEVIWNNASVLMKHNDVSIRVANLKEEAEALRLWSKAKSIKALAKIADNSDKGSEVVSAVKELNAMHGFNEPTKVAMSLTVNATVNYD